MSTEAKVLRFNASTGELVDIAIPQDKVHYNPHFVIPGPNRSLLFSTEGLASVRQFDAGNGAFLGAFVPTSFGGLKNPIGMRFNYEGDLLVASAFSDDVKRYDGRTGEYRGSFASGAGMKTPTGLTFGPNGNLFVISSGLYGQPPRILEFDGITGAFIRVFAEGAGLNWPGDLAFGADGILYVANYGGRNILKFNGATGASMGLFASILEPSQPVALAFGPDGNLYVPMLNGNVVRRYDVATGAESDDIKVDSAGHLRFLQPYNSADMTSDGRADLLFQSASGRNVRIAWPNVTPAGFTTMSATLPENTRVAAVADFNMDLRNDIVVQDTRSGGVSILFTHDHGFAIQRSVPMDATKLAPGEVSAAADFDGDGWPDLVVHNRTTNQTTILTMAGARIVGSQPLAQRLDSGWHVAGAADFDGDGKPDLVIQGPAGAISFLALNGVQITGSTSLDDIPGGDIGSVGDYDGDGRSDLVFLDQATRDLTVLSLVQMRKTASYAVRPGAPAGWKLVGPK